MSAKSVPNAPFTAYLKELQRNLASGIAAEHTHRHALQNLLEALDPKILAFNDPQHISVGAPDFTIRRKGRAHDFSVGWIETKDVGEDLNKVEKSDQLKRYFGLPNLILTDYLEFRWYTDGELRLKARLATASKKGKLTPEPNGEKHVGELLVAFLDHQIPTVASPSDLAKRMADLAHLIRDLILRSFEGEATAGKLHKEFEAFRQTLIPDLKPEQFADMYAQTIAYGLFAARCQPVSSGDRFSRERAAHLIPKTNPFLRRLFNEIAGPELDEKITPFVDDLVALLRDADMHSILADFGKRSGKEDPVVHFYEDFLQEYDPKVRELRGVYYTPEPVVSYIVRSVDHLLKTKFNKPLGLADKDVLILDPACGTGTFLYYVIRHIYQTLLAQGQKGKWNSYVSENLLKRIFGFELLMAPYAMAHLKLGLLLQELGYKFDSDERLGIFLTNTLEEAIKKSELIFAQYITDEANAASEIKRDKKIMVVLGNPPYSGHSANRSWEIKDGKKALTFIGRLLQDYYYVDGKPLGEKNPKWLQDDYVKFLRFGQWRIERTGYGVLALITNNGYLDNPTFRGMRQQLAKAFNEIRVLDLHGSSKKKEKSPEGTRDQNVFDIQQGVAIGLFVKEEGPAKTQDVRRCDLWGSREHKYESLARLESSITPWERLDLRPPLYEFLLRRGSLTAEYESYWKVTDIFPVNVLGFQSHRDHFAIDLDDAALRSRIQEMRSNEISDDQFREKHGLRDNRDWQLANARKLLRAAEDWQQDIIQCLYRPFDRRSCYFSEAAMDYPRRELILHVARKANLCLNTVRQTKMESWQHALVSDAPAPAVYVELKDGSNVFPLYLYGGLGRKDSLFEFAASDQEATTKRPNLNPTFISEIQRKLGLNFVPTGQRKSVSDLLPETVFEYVYAVFYSPSFSQRYLEYLKSDFPRVPITSDKKLFTELAIKGSELISIHLLKTAAVNRFVTHYDQPGDHHVEKVRYLDPNPLAKIKAGRVYINAKQYFDGVPKDVWQFHIGGYQVCEKWLKDRKGRHLSADDIDHYQKIVVALKETIRLMAEIDALIPSWPLP